MTLTQKHDSIIIACAVMLVLLGGLAIFKLPNALLPQLDRPQIAVVTPWPGRTASEIQQVLISPLERQLAGIAHLKNFQTNISHGQAWTTLNFHHLADMQKTYMEVLARINRVAEWPAQVPRPRVIDYSNGAGSTLASLFLYSKDAVSKETFRRAYRGYIEPALMAIPGIAQINVDNNRMSQRVDIEFDPIKLSQFSLSIDAVANQLQELVDRSGDRIRLGSKDYLLEFQGQIPIDELRQLPLAVSNARVIRLGDIAEVEKRFVHDWSYSAFKGHNAIYFFVQPDGDINVLSSIEKIKQTIDELNQGALANLDLTLAMSRDNSIAIKEAISVVYGSLALGILLAAVLLLFFLRKLSVVTIIMLSVPVCLSLVAMGMYSGGISLNLISLAGMALSVGLLVDASIVVVENIQRLRDNGLSLLESCRQGTQQVRGALIASTVSSIVIFVPILLMESTAGQLFNDLAFTLSTALLSSIVVALILLPALCRKLMSNSSPRIKFRGHHIGQLLCLPARKPIVAYSFLLVGLPVALLVTWLSQPATDMLPSPKENIVMVYSQFDESLSVSAAREQIAQTVETRIAEQRGQLSTPKFDIHGMFCTTRYCLLYFYPEGEWQFNRFKQWVENKITHDLADINTVVYQGNLLRIAMPNAQVTQLDLKGIDEVVLKAVGQDLMKHLRDEHPGARISPVVPLTNTTASIQFTPKREKLAFIGLSQGEFNRQLVALTDGRYLGQFYTGSDTLPFFFKGKAIKDIDDLLSFEIVLDNGRTLALRDVVDVKLVSLPSALYRSDADSAIGFNLVPPEGQPVGEFVSEIKASVNQFLAQSDASELSVNYRGSGDELAQFLQEFAVMFVIAMMILWILMRITLGSWRMAFAVMLSIPLALMGGMLFLKLMNIFVNQNLDIVTMIGFIILMGLVINNAILLVSQYNTQLALGHSQFCAIEAAVVSRLRPIYMSTGTSILGMLPLMLNTGNGAEVYRGLAAVIIGGMMASAMLSLSFMSALLSLKMFGKRQDEISVQARNLNNIKKIA